MNKRHILSLAAFAMVVVLITGITFEHKTTADARGGLVGGLVGAGIGAAATGGRTAGAITGGVTGGLIGSSIDDDYYNDPDFVESPVYYARPGVVYEGDDLVVEPIAQEYVPYDENLPVYRTGARYNGSVYQHVDYDYSSAPANGIIYRAPRSSYFGQSAPTRSFVGTTSYENIPATSEMENDQYRQTSVSQQGMSSALRDTLPSPTYRSSRPGGQTTKMDRN